MRAFSVESSRAVPTRGPPSREIPMAYAGSAGRRKRAAALFGQLVFKGGLTLLGWWIGVGSARGMGNGMLAPRNWYSELPHGNSSPGSHSLLKLTSPGWSSRGGTISNDGYCATKFNCSYGPGYVGSIGPTPLPRGRVVGMVSSIADGIRGRGFVRVQGRASIS